MAYLARARAPIGRRRAVRAVAAHAAMHAAVAAGGEAGPVHSAALSVVGELIWPIVDLRVDWADEDPIGRLDQLWQAYRPQMQDYLTRALNPTAAPSYGVPGNE